jgi:hypothetical protein
MEVACSTSHILKKLHVNSSINVHDVGLIQKRAVNIEHIDNHTCHLKVK